MNASSEQGIRLDWPKVKPPQRSFLRRGFVLLSVLFVVVTGGGWVWWTLGYVTAESAMVDGRTYTVTPRMTDTVTQVLVSVGQSVTAGQPLMRLHGGSYRAELAEARQQVQTLRPPTIEETAERVARAQATEASMVQRIALARGEESNRRKIIEESVATHVKAQLVVRGMDAQGLQRQPAYAKAKQAESAARLHMDAARAAAEEASRIRTAVEGELQRVRREMEAYRAQNGGLVAQSTPQGAPAPMPAVDDISVLTAPVAGRVALVQAVAGQRVERGQAVVQLVPSAPSSAAQGAAAEDLWVLAVFAEKDIVHIRPGQPCTVGLDAYSGQSLRGEVQAIIPATAAIMNLLHPADGKKHTKNANSDSTAGLIPVRVKLLPQADTAVSDMFLGMGATVKVQTRKVPALLERFL